MGRLDDQGGLTALELVAAILSHAKNVQGVHEQCCCFQTGFQMVQISSLEHQN